MVNVDTIGEQLAESIRQIFFDILDILTPIISVLGVAMIILGLVIAIGLRQEWIGYRLVIGGGLALATVHLLIPTLLGFL